MTSLTESPVPRKLNPGMIEALSLVIAKGNYPSVACSLVGIEWHTLQRWLQLADDDLKALALLDDDEVYPESLYIQLLTALKRAEAEAEGKMVEVVRNAAIEKKEWLPAITFLERRHPDRWGRKDRTKIDITETKKVLITHVEIVMSGAEHEETIEGEVREIE